MGRTLHWSLKNSEALSKEDAKTFTNVSEKYNSGKFKGIWTCENFWCQIREPEFVDAKVMRDFPEHTGNMWSHLYNVVAKDYATHVEKEEFLEKEGYITRGGHFGSWFCKTGGNELNSMLVLYALVELSLLTPAEFALSDEGDFLRCPVFIKDGKVSIDKETMFNSIEYWKKQKFLEPGNYPEVLATYNDYIDLLQKYENNWVDPVILHRPVDPKDFEDYEEYNVKQIMAGFNGEYWGLNTEDPELESYKRTAEIKKMLDIDGLNVTMEVATKI